MVKFARSFFSRAMLITVVCEALVVIACESLFFYRMSINLSNYKEDSGQGLPVYFGIFLASQIFQIVLVADAIRMQNTIQIIGFFGFNLCCFVYSILQYFQIQEAVYAKQRNLDFSWWISDRPLLIIVAATIGLCQIAYGWLSFRLYQEFGWKIYKKIGADLQKRRMYRDYHICLMFLKLDLFFFMGFCIQLLVLALDADPREFIFTIAALPISLLAIMMAAYALKREAKKIMIVVFCALFTATAYFVAKLALIWLHRDNYEFTKKYLTAFALLSLIAVSVTIAIGYRCYRNFGRGLRPYLMQENTNVEMLQSGQTRIVLDDDDDDEDDLDITSSPNSSRPFARRPANVLSMQL